MAGLDLSKLKKQHSKKNFDSEKSGRPLEQILNKEITLFGDSWGNKQKEHFYSEMYILLTSGLDVQAALDIVEHEHTKKKHKEIIKDIRQNIIAGSSFYEASRDTGKFTPYEYYSLQVGEESGRLNDILLDLAVFYNDRIKLQRQVISMLSYPILVTATALGTVAFMLNFIVPMFADVFKRFGGELPALTQFILNLSNITEQILPYVVLAILAIIVILYRSRKATWYRKYKARFLLSLPVVKNLVRKTYLARFSRMMALLTSAKIPMITSIELVSKMINFYPIEQHLEVVKMDILQGKSLHQSLGKFPLIDAKLVSLIRVGEEVNQLDTMFRKLSDQYTEEMKHQTDVVTSLLEPLLILFLATIVGIILIAMYLPMFQLSSNFE